MSKGLGFSLADLQAKKKELNESEGPISEAKADAKVAGESKESEQELQALRDMYIEMGGDIERIFHRYGENPRKALKYPPRDEFEFAHKVTYLHDLIRIAH